MSFLEKEYPNLYIAPLLTHSVIIISILLGFISFALNELLSSSLLGLFLSIFLSVFILVGSFLKRSLAFQAFIILIISSSPQSRMYDDIVSGIISIESSFYTFNSASSGLPTLSLLVLIGLSLISLLRIFMSKKKNIFIFELNAITLLIVSIFISSIGAFIFSLEREHFNLSYAISDFRLPLVLMCSFLLVSDMRNIMDDKFLETIGQIIIMSALLNGIEGLLCVIFDYMKGQSLLMIGTQPSILMPAFFMFMYLARNVIFTFRFMSLAIVLIGAFRFSRGDIIYSAILIFMYIILIYSANESSIKKHKNFFRLLFFLIVIILSIPLFLPFVSERLWLFLLFKLSFFMPDGIISGNTGVSAGIRVYEYVNILNVQLHYLIFGKGIGAYFTFDSYPLPYALTLSDFSQDQISSGYFYKPHTFVNMILLKYGILVLVFYIYSAVHLFIKSKKIISMSRCSNTQALCVFTGCMSLYMLNMYWQPTLIFIVVLCLYLVNVIDQKHKKVYL